MEKKKKKKKGRILKRIMQRKKIMNFLKVLNLKTLKNLKKLLKNIIEYNKISTNRQL